jgi:outer membrane protein TolC
LGNRTARNTYKADRATLQSVLLAAKKEEWTIVTAIDNDIKAIEADLLKVDYTRQARLFAEDALEAGQAELKEGKRINFEVLQFQDNLTAARSAEISALSDYNTALEQLALDEGVTLERNHIDLRFH